MERMIAVLFSAGTLLVFYAGIGYLINGLRFQISNKKKENKTAGSEHLHKIFMVLSKEGKEKRDMTIFVVISFLLLFFPFSVLIRMAAIHKTLLISFAMALLPYAYIRSKLAVVQRNGSFEGKWLMKEFTAQYKMNYNNIIPTLDAMVQSACENEPVAKKALFRMASRVKTYRGEQELKQILDDFSYSFDTEWARMLASNIFNAVYEKADILAGLEDLLENCKKINQSIEKRKRDSVESIAMVKYLGPALAIGFAVMAANTLSLTKVISYQFGTPNGLMLFCILMIVMFVNYVSVNLILNQKYDF